MAFNAAAFAAAPLSHRQETVPVPDLAPWFEGDAAPTWTVRGLTGNELAKADAARDRLKREAALAAALVSGSQREVAEAVQEALGRTDATEPDFARRLELVTLGSVEPACTLDTVVRLAEHFPVVFYQLSNKILELSGRGSDAEKKPSDSGDETPPATS